jgi:peptidyl-tRNA hydrolase, PTH1 family
LKYLITGLGNIGELYAHTRHNIGFDILDALSGTSNISFSDGRYGFTAELKYKGRILILLKPSTFVNLSGKAVSFYMKKHKIEQENLLVVLDDIALPFGTLRVRKSGGDAGHNGLINITEILGSQNFARLRFGIGNDFPQGFQVQHVLGKWDAEEEKQLPAFIEKACEAVKSFTTVGIERTMNTFNKN